MRDSDPVIENVLDRLVPPAADEAPDWEEVLRRAEHTDGGTRPPVAFPRPRGRRRAWYALAAAALLTVAVANPAFGIGSRILEWFEGTPAPQHVKDDLARFADDRRAVVAMF